MAKDLYQEVTDRIVNLLESGIQPWAKDWSTAPGHGIPCNAVTNRRYNGINVLLYWISAHKGYAQPRYLTFNQCRNEGGNVKKGSKGESVILFQPKKITVTNKTTGEPEEKNVAFIRGFTVFNVDQCENLPEKIVNGPKAKELNKDERMAEADEFIKTSGADFREGKGEPMYIPSKDYVTVPNFKQFHSKESYYHAAFHELAHWTGHKSRLDRNFKSRFDKEEYAMEELVAELTAAFLCAEFGLKGYETNNAAYLASWIKVLKNDKRAIFTAVSAAQKAADFLRGKALAEDKEAA
jgi:antirestriction protein ArdC